MPDQIIKILDALSDPTRVEIVRDLLAGHKGVCPEMKEKTGKSQPTLSHHIGKLKDADILIETKKGKNCYYKVNSNFLRNYGINIKKLVNHES